MQDLSSVYIEKNAERVSDLNVLHISRTMGQGGAEKIVYQLAIGLKDNLGNVFVASSGGVYARKLEEENIRHFQIFDLECKKPWIMFQTLMKLKDIIEQEHIDIVHTHHRMAAVYAFLLKHIFPGIRLIYTAHNIFSDKKWLTHLVLSHVSIVAVGKNVYDNLIHFKISPKNIRIIYNAVQIEPIQEEYKNLQLEELKRQDAVLIGVIGRLSKQKGIDVFIKVIYELRKRDKRIKGIVIGEGELRKELEVQAENLHIQDSIFFLGYQQHVTTLISQIDMVIMPSQWEGFPLLPIEVFSQGGLLIGNDIGGINEIVRDGENGRLISKNNIEAFVRETAELLLHPEYGEAMRKNALAYYNQNFSYDNFVKEYSWLYKDVMREG